MSNPIGEFLRMNKLNQSGSSSISQWRVGINGAILRSAAATGWRCRPGKEFVFRCVALALPVSSFLNVSNERQGDRVWINGKTRSSSLTDRCRSLLVAHLPGTQSACVGVECHPVDSKTGELFPQGSQQFLMILFIQSMVGVRIGIKPGAGTSPQRVDLRESRVDGMKSRESMG